MMKFLVLHNEGVICILLLFVTIIRSSFVGERFQTIQDLCSSNRYIYNLQPGESHQVRLTSDDSEKEVNKWYQKHKRRCRKEFKANNGASHFNIVISNMSIPSCSEKCQCNYFEISEPGRAEKFCGKIKKDLYFESKHDYLKIDFQHGLSLQFDVTLTFTVERNVYIITGSSKEGLGSGNIIETPYFPQTYQSDYISEYVLQPNDVSDHVILTFLDFQIAPESFIEIVGHNGTHPERFNGNVFRPPVIVSQHFQLNLKFQANQQVRAGFRAICFFVKDSDIASNKPYTKCGGIKDGYGGAISINTKGNHIYYDCLWLISPPVFPFAQSSFLSLLNISLQNLGPAASLEFREGLNSKSKLVKTITCQNFTCSLPSEITVSASSGLYIRFNGILRHDSVVNMVYGTHHGGNCSEEEVSCNDRCFLPSLRCDGVRHCADGRDEQGCDATTTSTSSSVTRKVINSRKSKESFILFVGFGICGIVLIFCVMGITIYRHIKVRPMHEEARIQPVAANEMTASTQRSQLFSRPIPLSDQPPSYDDFIRCSDCYPPLLYTRAAKRHSEPFPPKLQHTTSFCGKEQVVAHSFDLHSLCSSNYSGRNSSDESCQPSCSFDRSNDNVEWTFNESKSKKTTSSLRKSASYDSKLNKNCLHLSITHSMCTHEAARPCIVKHNSLPTRFTIKDRKPNEIDIVFQTVIPGLNIPKDRRFSSCIICHESVTIRSEIMTSVKARCNSDPCHGNSPVFFL